MAGFPLVPTVPKDASRDGPRICCKRTVLRLLARLWDARLARGCYPRPPAAHWTARGLDDRGGLITKRTTTAHVIREENHRAARPGSGALCGPARRRAWPRGRHARAGSGDTRPVRRAEENTPEFRRAGAPGGGGYGHGPRRWRRFLPDAGAGAARSTARGLLSTAHRAVRHAQRHGDRVDCYMGMPMASRGSAPRARHSPSRSAAWRSIASPRHVRPSGRGSSYCWADPDSRRVLRLPDQCRCPIRGTARAST
jgi:hypothetical protein